MNKTGIHTDKSNNKFVEENGKLYFAIEIQLVNLVNEKIRKSSFRNHHSSQY